MDEMKHTAATPVAPPISISDATHQRTRRSKGIGVSPARRVALVVREAVVTIALVAVIFVVSRQVVQNVQVQGISMLPTLQDNELVLIDTLSYRFHPPRRGDIIILHPPLLGTEKQDYVKRVIGLPGETVQVHHGTVFINGKALSEPYIHEPHTYDWPLGGDARRVPPGDLFVLGDNRDKSYDSHWWPSPYLPENEVVGRVMLAYWPLNDLHLFSAPAFASSRRTDLPPIEVPRRANSAK